MENINLNSWVKEAINDDAAEFRKAVHTLFIAISNSAFLRKRMFIKGGLLLAVRYHSTRFTKDADFSTPEMFADFDEEKFKEELKQQLADAVETLDYGLDCRVQKYRVTPPGEDKTFQTLQVNIGYAYKGSRKHRTLIENKCATVLKIDYSFNERNYEKDAVLINNTYKLSVYSLPDLIAEKYRSIIQQKIRNRSRRQDAYDIYMLLTNGTFERESISGRVLKSLILKSESRNLSVDRHTLRDREIIQRSKKDYEKLSQEINEDLPHFDYLFNYIRDFYEELPWKDE